MEEHRGAIVMHGAIGCFVLQRLLLLEAALRNFGI